MTVEKVEGAKYVVATDAYAYEGCNTGKYVKQGDVVTLTKDDGTAAPLFRVPNGKEVFLRMKDLVKLNIDGEEPLKKTVKTITQEEFDSIEVGDKVTVRADLHTGLAVRNGVVTSMTELAGKTVTVTGLCNSDVKVDGRPQYWSKEMFTAVIKQEKPKFAVGDLVITLGESGNHPWHLARRITAVNTDTHEYEMEWADGEGTMMFSSPMSFYSAEENLTYYKGKVPTEETAAQSRITAEQFAAIKVGDKLKLRTDLKVGKGYGIIKWVPEKADLAARGVTPVVTRIDGDDTVKADAEGDFWWYSAEMIAEVIPAEDEFNCPELVVGQVYVNAHGSIFRYIRKYTKEFMYMDAAQGTFLGTTGYFSDDLKECHYTLCGTWRKATAEEVAKLEAAEKEHGYVPPLVNKVGTVIEAGKYYKIKSSSTTEYICKVVEVYEGSFLKAGLLVELDGTPTDTKTPPTTTINSTYGAYAVPATDEQIALYEAVLALRTAQKTFEEATQAVKEAA